MEDTRIAVLSIIVEDSESTAKLNEMIHDYAEYVVGRMGIPYREKNISIISLVIDAPQTKISELSGKIGRLSGVTAKAAIAILAAAWIAIFSPEVITNTLSA